MHNASLESDRLQRVLDVLRNAGCDGATTLDISKKANVLAVSSVVSELRACGVAVNCQFEGMGENKSKIYRYRLG